MTNTSLARQRRLAKRSGTPVIIDSTDTDEPGRVVSPSSSQPSSSIHLTIDLTFNPMSRAAPQSRLLIASLGNPAPYLETRHSAGHILLKSLASELQCPPFSRTQSLAKGLTTVPYDRPDWLLWQSPSYMNVSGPALRDALAAFIRQGAGAGTTDTKSVGLVILHDEMELAPGTVKERGKNTSNKGHNGLKSVWPALQQARLFDRASVIKLGVGIGRPESREPDVVSAYVLKKMTWEERLKIEDGTGQALKLIETFAKRISPQKPAMQAGLPTDKSR